MENENLSNDLTAGNTSELSNVASETATVKSEITAITILHSLCDLPIKERLKLYNALEKVIQHDRERNGMGIDPGTDHIEYVINSLVQK